VRRGINGPFVGYLIISELYQLNFELKDVWLVSNIDFSWSQITVTILCCSQSNHTKFNGTVKLDLLQCYIFDIKIARRRTGLFLALLRFFIGIKNSAISEHLNFSSIIFIQ
jgi:hypothetical protein